MLRTVRRQIWAVGVCVVAVLAVASASPAGDESSVRLPAAGELLASRVAVRAAPSADARVVRVMKQFRSDSQFQVVLAVSARRDSDGAWWYLLSLPGRPNGQRGWVQGDVVDLHPMNHRIVVHVGSRTLAVRRISDGRLLLRAVVAVGKPGAETPLGRDFYVQARFAPDDPFFGPLVLETSAYSKLSEWPGGGLAGIHGTDRPDLLGRAVSHGCVRVSNAVDRALARLAPLGTPIDLLP
jgi:lipoprotein-anchoring transpeptidase ErfK/SrfK